MARARRSRWYDRSRRVIDALLPQVRPELGVRAARSFLHAHYPFAAKVGAAWKQWRQAVKDALAILFPAVPAAGDAPPIRCHPRAGVTCGWCGSEQSGCLVCLDVRRRFALLTEQHKERWSEALSRCRESPPEYLILADFVDEELGLPEEAAHLRNLGRRTR